MGRPKGAKNKATLLKEATIAKYMKQSGDLMIAKLPGVIEMVVKKALDGDMTAAKLVLERCIPARKAVEHYGKEISRDIKIIIGDSKPRITEDITDVNWRTEQPTKAIGSNGKHLHGEENPPATSDGAERG